MSTQTQGSGYYVVTDPDQEKLGIFKVAKTANIATTMLQLNAARSAKDFRIVKFFACADLKKLTEFVESALKAKYIPNSKEWVKLDDAGLAKVLVTIETLADIVNDS